MALDNGYITNVAANSPTSFGDLVTQLSHVPNYTAPVTKSARAIHTDSWSHSHGSNLTNPNASGARNTGIFRTLLTFFANSFENFTQSSIFTPEIGIKGHTSVAPILAWAPLCRLISIISVAF